jgi:ubiquinone/menaquinone biosynthesis C-methylase UbiE
VSESFDRYKESYRDAVDRSISFSGQGVDFFTEVKATQLEALANRRLGDPTNLKVLDVGCGAGLTDGCLNGVFGELHGVDLSRGMIDAAAKANPDVRYSVYDGQTLPFRSETFDLSFAICVLHHVPTGAWKLFVDEMTRVTKPGGLVAILEHNPLNPLTRLAVNRCEFDKDAVLLRQAKTRRLLGGSGLQPVEQRYILFFPWRGQVLRRVEEKLRALPAGAQYMVAARKPSLSNEAETRLSKSVQQ